MTFELRYIKTLADVKCLGNKTDEDDEEMRYYANDQTCHFVLSAKEVKL